MREAWTGELLGKMHVSRVSRKDLSDKLGVGKSYITMILNGERNPAGAQERLEKAFEEIVSEREGEE